MPRGVKLTRGVKLIVVTCAPSVVLQFICVSWFRTFTLLCCKSQNTNGSFCMFHSALQLEKAFILLAVFRCSLSSQQR